MPPHYVKPYVKRNKNDAADAAAICEAVTRPTMRFVSVKTTEQQSILMLHRTNELLTRQRTMLINAIRAHMTEFGIVAPTGVPQVRKLFRVIADTDDTRLPPVARSCLESLARQFLSLHEEIGAAKKKIHAWHRSNEVSCRPLASGRSRPVPWRLPLAILMSSRTVASWPPGLGWYPGRTQPAGNNGSVKHLNREISICAGYWVVGAMSVIRQAKRRGTSNMPWLDDMTAKVAAVALASKNARVIWALMKQGGTYQKPVTVPAA